ncbi:AAA-like domain-containing protein [Calothrix sp. FACHB-1219]|uniref:AAA-like domain-containing protein n=1 Tax=unclassified Calothrix TaxID=2619626 RepID=UPI001681D467|nr:MULTISPECIES: AAA-like domain-containing protein [unclassified Calothrix]MBD2206025.1 AAA-like domain-containing protein [Calothrix sp. FACHB-168]MBD2220800.1 AAA-like domain-containing protein [Calothrix sp. FACHB-1219]
MTNDQYIFSGSLPENSSTYVTRQADGDLYAGLKAGKFCYVLNSRQSGKSSLRVRTMQRLREEGVQCAAIDLSAGGVQNVPPEQWYADLIDNLIENFDLDVDFGDWWEANQLNSLVTRFRKFLEEILLVEVKENIVIFIDEIDSVLSLNFPTDDFFAMIRACYNKRVDNPEYNRLTFCLLGVASPSNLIKDKQRTPFNIGQAISLTGFQLHEVEPLAKGMSGRFSHPQAVMKEILYWTGGQPFLTQKLCQLMMEESLQNNSRTVEQVVKSRIIENWESQDEPEHLRTIQARILRDEQRAGYLLELYQQMRLRDEKSEIKADDTLEQSELQLSGLVFRQQNNLRVYNRIYQEVFNRDWIDNQLKNLRPYSENFRFWVASEGKDTSRLLRGKALEEAEVWARDKSLSYQDRQFLAASKEQEIQEEIAAKEKEAALERERKDKEAAESRNKLLSEANRKSQKQIRNGAAILFVAVFIAVILGVFAAREANKALQAQKRFEEANTKAQQANTKTQEAEQKVIALQQQAQQVQKIADAAKQEAQKATEKAKEEQKKADDANQKATAAREEAKNAQIKADEANKQAKVEQQNAEEAQKNAAEANQQATKAKEQAKVEQQNAEEAQKNADDAKRQAQVAKKEAENLQAKLALAKKDVENVQKLSELAGELRNANLTSESDEALRLAGLSFNVKDYKLKQALLLASSSQAYQHLKNWDEAEKEIKESNNFLAQADKSINSSEGLQIQVLANKVKGNLLAEKKEINQAIESYESAFEIINNYPERISPFTKNNQLLAAEDVAAVHRNLLKLLSTNTSASELRERVEKSLTQHLYAQLEYFLKPPNQNWGAADYQTYLLMLNIAKKEEQSALHIHDINNFSCPDLKKIDQLWITNSGNRFGFSVQKEIWIKTGNRLGIKPQEWNKKDEENYFRISKAVGWYVDKKTREEETGSRGGYWVSYDEHLRRIKNDPYYGRGSLPWIVSRSIVVSETDASRVSWIPNQESMLFYRIATCKV